VLGIEPFFATAEACLGPHFYELADFVVVRHGLVLRV
jgi:hypothetical protein